MNSSNEVIAPIQDEADMRNAHQRAVARTANAQFNVNKLQAAACITASSAVSIAIIYWAIKSLF